ncbi:cation transporter [bacterium]|nr:cation transporter [bacterium]
MSEKKAKAVLVISTVANVALMAMKLSVGFLAHSRALVADGINSTLDIFFSVMILLSFRWASKPADKDHPYGHGNIEVLVAFIAALIIVATGGVIIYDGIRSAINPALEAPGMLALIAEGVTIASKLFLYIYATSVAKRFRSPAVSVQAADHRSDIMATSAAVVSIFLARIGIKFFDPVGAAIVGSFIIWTGIRLIKENIHVLIETRPEDKFFAKVEEALSAVKEVRKVYGLRAHPVGTYFFLEITVSVNGNLTVKKGHDIAEQVRLRLMEREQTIKDVIVHVEPEEHR